MAGTSFCLSSAGGDMIPGFLHGLFYRDTRFLSGWQLAVDGRTPELLSVVSEEPFSATFIGRVPPPTGHADSSLLVLRSRSVADSLREDVVVRNLAGTPARVELRILIATDFASLFQVKDGRAESSRPMAFDSTASGITLSSIGVRPLRGVSIDLPPGALVSREPAAVQVVVQVEIPARSDHATHFQLTFLMDGRPAVAARPADQGGRSGPAPPSTELHSWRRRVTSITASDPTLDAALTQGVEDLGALRMTDPDGSGTAVIAAGAPWFMALFGRDSLLTAWMALALDVSLAVDTLTTLGRYQGQVSDPNAEEQPGRILHEMRWGLTHESAGDHGSIYYGTVDAPALFVMLWGEAAKWLPGAAFVEELMPSVDRALGWIASRVDSDPDGFLTYHRASGSGLVNQGWKDSWDGINFADGRMAQSPIALCEVQGYVYAAYVARARVALAVGDHEVHAIYTERARALKEAFNRVFWLDHLGYFALGLDHERARIDSLTSNIGHCLWTGIIDSDRAPSVVDRLMSAEMFTGWGLRTLSNRMGAYNPVSYHNGSVWPHDTALAVAGLVRYGFCREAGRLAQGLVDAAGLFAGRLPELFCGFSRDEFPVPISYPTSCSPQAWAAATPLSLVTSLVGLEADTANRRLTASPYLPREMGTVRFDGLRFDGHSLVVEATGTEATVSIPHTT